jgi:hypothetical protein
VPISPSPYPLFATLTTAFPTENIADDLTGRANSKLKIQNAKLTTGEKAISF